MAENLKTTKYKNGDEIGTTDPPTMNLSNSPTDPKYQWAYAGDESNVESYGRLYTFFAVIDNRNVCPSGWHVSTSEDWTMLFEFLISNGFNFDGTFIEDKVAKSIASDAGWIYSSNQGAVGNTDYPFNRNKTGFSALPGGFRATEGVFVLMGEQGSWWTSTAGESPGAGRSRILSYNYDHVRGDSNMWARYGFSVRCLKD
jgi:uncharacterized protein (TIGR02145 family)